MCVAATAATRHVMSNPDKSDSVAFDSCAPPMPSGEILFIVHVMIPAR